MKIRNLFAVLFISSTAMAKGGDPGGIGRMKVNPPVVQLKVQGRAAIALSRANGIWKMERPRSMEEATALTTRRDVHIIILGMTESPGAAQLDEKVSSMRTKMSDMYMEERADVLLTQLHLATLILQSDRPQLWTKEDSEIVLGKNSPLTSQWAQMAETDQNLATEILRKFTELAQ